MPKSKGNSKKNRRPQSSTETTSRALSWALRHQAVAIGLTITPDGYVPVQEILDSKHPKLQGISLESIQQMVETNDKQRFKLVQRPKSAYYQTQDDDDDEETILCIRANQGHSLSVIDPTLLLNPLSQEELERLPCIIHGTYAEPWKIISTTGLKKMTRTHIHFASGLPEADGVISGMRKTCTVHIYINALKCAQNHIPFYKSDNGVILTAGIDGILPCEYFSHVTDSNGQILLDNR